MKRKAKVRSEREGGKRKSWQGREEERRDSLELCQFLKPFEVVDPVVVEVQLFELGESLKDVRFQGCETVLTETESFEEGTEAREVEGRKGGVDELKVGEFEVLHEGVK